MPIRNLRCKTPFQHGLPREVVGSLEVFQNCRDVALREVGSGHGGGGLGLDMVILVVFSNLSVSVPYSRKEKTVICHLSRIPSLT